MGLFSRLGNKIASVFQSKKLDAETLENLLELLIGADIDASVANDIIVKLRSKFKPGDDVTDTEIKSALSDIMFPMVQPLECTWHFDATPTVILISGVNGAGKTTTIGKLANQWKADGKKVLIGACDTFRSAAVEQLDVWAGRAGVEMVSKIGCDPAAVAYSTTELGLKQGADIVLLDTAGRLHSRSDLMDELGKITRVIQKVIPDAPHESVLVLDGTTGQNALLQIEHFAKISPLTGIIITKLDGSSRGGALISYASKTKNPLPVYAVGFGEKLDDLRPFNARDYVNGLVGLTD